MPPTWSPGLASVESLLLVPKRWFFISGFYETWQKSQRDRRFAFPLPKGIVETPDAPPDERLRLGLRCAQYEL